MDGTTKDGDDIPAKLEAQSAAARSWDEATLIAGICRGDERALEELYVRYLPMLVAATRRLRVPPSDRREQALDVITDVAMQLLRGDRPVPRNLSGFLATVLRRRVLDRARRDASRVPEVPFDEAREASLGIIRDVENDATPALVQLVDHLEQQCDETELQVLHWLGEHVPQRTIADWLGVSHGAARMRIGRLRDRLREVARTYWRVLDDDTREELARFFQRFIAPPIITPPKGPGRAPGGRRHGSST